MAMRGPAMNLLLLLSALLSALTGTSPALREPAAAHAVRVAAAATVAASPAHRQAEARPVQPLPVPALTAAAPLQRALSVRIGNLPLYAGRRRE